MTDLQPLSSLTPKPGASIVGAISLLAGTTGVMLSALMHHAMMAVPHHAAALPMLPAALVPLMLPRVGAGIRHALLGQELTVAGDDRAAAPVGACGADGANAELRRANAVLRAELRALKTAYAALRHDAAARDAAAERLNHLAHHDALTDLPNRVLLMERLAQALTVAKRAGTGVIVIYLDLDNFKAINDTLGHAAGDRVLCEVGERLARCMRRTDTASRLGGDEFVLVCATADGIGEAPQIAARVLAAIAEPIDVFGTPVTLGASLGISISPGDGGDAAELLEKADRAMYCAKQRGRNCFNVFTSLDQADIEAQSVLETELRAALALDQFEVHYQPIVDLYSGNVSGAEALVRWRHPTRGLIGPQEFMAFADERGLGPQIGTRVLRAACGQIKRFALRANDDFSISINVSPNQFRDPDFVSSIAAVLAATATQPRRIALEIKERMVADGTAFVSTLRELEALGVTVAIDDFGTGVSSLAEIKHLPVTTLKIDRSFVRDIAANAGDAAIAKTIVTLAHSLGMHVIAEGVETDEQVQILRALGSDSFQGFWVSEPLPAGDFERFACTYGPVKLAA